jgi:hypothetical protein
LVERKGKRMCHCLLDTTFRLRGHDYDNYENS